PRLQEQFHSLERVCDDARARARGFKYPRRRRKSETCHALAVYIENRFWRAVEGVMVSRVNMANVTNVWALWFVIPSIASKQKLSIRQSRRRFQKEFIHSRLAVGQAISKET